MFNRNKLRIMDELPFKDLYYTPGLPTSYGGIDRLLKGARRVNRNITREQVKHDWLLAQDSYTLHKRARKRLSAEPRVYVKGIDEQWSLDLCDVSNISQYNDDCNFILTLLMYSQNGRDSEPVKRKSGPQTTRALEQYF